MNKLTFLNDEGRDAADYIIIHEFATVLKEDHSFTDEKLKKAMRRIMKYYLTTTEYAQFKLWLKEEE